MAEAMFEVRESDGTTIVREMQSDVYFLTVESYAKIAGQSYYDILQKAIEAVRNNPGDKVPNKYQVFDLGLFPIKGVRGCYLIPAELAFYWLMTDCRTKALLLGGEALAASVKNQFESVGEPIKQGKTVRLKSDSKPVAVLEFHKHHVYFEHGDLATVLEFPIEQVYAGYADDDAMLLVKKWGKREPLKVRVNVKDLELMEDRTDAQ